MYKDTENTPISTRKRLSSHFKIKRTWSRGLESSAREIGGRLKKITPVQLSTEHNANMEPVQDELRSQHPKDPNIVVMKHGVWRVNGLIQVSRAIGDAYLKRPEFNREPLLAKFQLPEPFDWPILSSEPSVCIHRLQPKDQFVVFASDGLWEHLSQQEVMDIIDNYPRNGIAKRLIKAALKVAARKREIRY